MKKLNEDLQQAKKKVAQDEKMCSTKTQLRSIMS